jgi:hypothetical protein
MRIDVEKVREIIEEHRRLQNLNPNEVELYENGVKIDVPQKFIDEWRFIGLGFCGFIETEFYKTGWIDGSMV